MVATPLSLLKNLTQKALHGEELKQQLQPREAIMVQWRYQKKQFVQMDMGGMETKYFHELRW